ncbi:MAG: hypothetical protein LKE41_00620 [Prevotella sp.]|jgi:hypothetical protein|nr:hypothetical protein [Prevotella sp.]MCI2102428.1 hypothetical protein [Prevotella sp.]
MFIYIKISRLSLDNLPIPLINSMEVRQADVLPLLDDRLDLLLWVELSMEAPFIF